MTLAAKHDPDWRWELTLAGADTLADDLGVIGAWVGPRTGPFARTHGEKENARARASAARQTDLDGEIFPQACPYSPKQLVDPDFVPE
jgi:hypothetical protein